MREQQLITTPDNLFDDFHKQGQAYEIISAEDRRSRYLFFAGDVGDVPGPGGMRVQSPCVPRKTLYRCMVTPCVTVRKLELSNLIPEGAVVPGSADRIKLGCSEYWLNAGPEANGLLQDYGNEGEYTKNWGLVELQPELLRGLDWEKDVKPLKIQQVFFPEWPNLVETNADIRTHIERRMEWIREQVIGGLGNDNHDKFIAQNRDLYLSIGADMLRAVDSAQRHQEYLCNRSNIGVAQPHGNEHHKPGFDNRDEVSFKRSGMIKNTEALRKVAEEMKNGAKNGLDANSLKEILATVVPQQQAAFTPEMLAAAIVQAAQLLTQQQAQPADVPADLTALQDAKAKNKPNAKS